MTLPISLQQCGTCPIQHRAVCAYCGKEALAVLEMMKSYRTYQPGEPIMHAGDPMGFVASVVTGLAALSQTLEDGRRQMVGLLLPADFIGRPARTKVDFDVVAVTEVTLCRFERKPFEKLLADMPSLRARLLEMALDELDAAREWMLLLGRKRAREKIASLLAILAKRQVMLTPGKALDGAQFELKLTREAMADYLGLTIETVSRQMTALRQDGVITLEGTRKVGIPDYGRICEEAGHDYASE